MKKDSTYDIIDSMTERYMSDRNDSEAISYLMEKAKESEAYREYIRQHLEVLFSSSVALSDDDFDAENAFNRFRINTLENSATSAKIVRRTTKIWCTIAAAAAVMLAVVLPWAGYEYASDNIQRQFSDIRISTPNGSVTQMTLPDGSKVWLNAGSSIEYSQGFGVTDRDVKINGEACFDVTRHKSLPFTVSSGSAKLKVLGTKFTFSDYEDDPCVTVKLIRGHVDLSSKQTGEHMEMHANENLALNKQTGHMTKKKGNMSGSDSWTHGELFFDELPLNLIAHRLERAYGAKITVSQNLNRKSFYCTVNTSRMTIDDALKVISETNQVRYRRCDDGSYLLY